jgi:hypothetical protein
MAKKIRGQVRRPQHPIPDTNTRWYLFIASCFNDQQSHEKGTQQQQHKNNPLFLFYSPTNFFALFFLFAFVNVKDTTFSAKERRKRRRSTTPKERRKKNLWLRINQKCYNRFFGSQFFLHYVLLVPIEWIRCHEWRCHELRCGREASMRMYLCLWLAYTHSCAYTARYHNDTTVQTV